VKKKKEKKKKEEKGMHPCVLDEGVLAFFGVVDV